MLLKILDRLFVVVGALIFVQFPLFMQQYLMQLRGHVAELQLQVNGMQLRAQETGRTLEQYIQKFVSSPDSDFSHQGRVMQEMIDRLKSLSDALYNIDHASVLSRPYQFLVNFHYDIFKSTLNHFDMGLSFSVEGLVYALFGMLVGYGVFALLDVFFRKKKVVVNNE